MYIYIYIYTTHKYGRRVASRSEARRRLPGRLDPGGPRQGTYFIMISSSSSTTTTTTTITSYIYIYIICTITFTILIYYYITILTSLPM